MTAAPPTPTSPLGPPFVVTGIGELVTMEPLAMNGGRQAMTPYHLGLRGPGAWLAIDSEGLVSQVGQGPLPAWLVPWPKLDAQGGLVLPGFVDSHTHPLWAGQRDGEFVAKVAGQTYQQIAEAGGGILATVRATRAASDDVLRSLLQARLVRMRALGTTTLEVKSGYGLSVAEELRHLRLLHEAACQLAPQGLTSGACQQPPSRSLTLSVTCLALHAASPEFATMDDYVAACCQELLPEAHRQGYVASVDAFVEEGYYTPKMVEPYLQKARDLGLMIRLHADEFQESGAAALGAAWGARSLDHLQQISPQALPQVAAAGSVATLLPGTSLYSRLPWAKARPLRDAGIPVALATDFNPGSCLLWNLGLVAALGAVHCGLSLPEVLAAITYIPAMGLGLTPQVGATLPADLSLKATGKTQQTLPWVGFKGALAPGFDGDFILYSHPSTSAWLADFGQTPPLRVWTKGR